MTWSEYHQLSEQLAVQAHTATQMGEVERGLVLFAQAGEAEERALRSLDHAKVRTLGVTAVSTVALYYRARDYHRAQQIAHTFLGAGELPHFAVDQLQELLQSIWTAGLAEKAGIKFAPGDVVVSVKGGQVVYGGAPLDLIIRKVEEVQAMYYRTIEMLLGLPFRKRGAPDQGVQSVFKPWLFQAAPGSYQFAVRVQEPTQGDLFPEAKPTAARVATTFLDIVRASASDPDGTLHDVVPNPEYRSAFLKLTRNLAPTGKTFDQLDIRDASSPNARAISLNQPVRDGVNTALRKLRPQPLVQATTEPVTLVGRLRALHLDDDWLEITLDKPSGTHVKVHEAGESLDDVLGPMVNRRVVVTVAATGRNRYRLVDIEMEE